MTRGDFLASKALLYRHQHRIAFLRIFYLINSQLIQFLHIHHKPAEPIVVFYLKLQLPNFSIQQVGLVVFLRTGFQLKDHAFRVGQDQIMAE